MRSVDFTAQLDQPSLNIELDRTSNSSSQRYVANQVQATLDTLEGKLRPPTPPLTVSVVSSRASSPDRMFSSTLAMYACDDKTSPQSDIFATTLTMDRAVQTDEDANDRHPYTYVRPTSLDFDQYYSHSPTADSNHSSEEAMILSMSQTLLDPSHDAILSPRAFPADPLQELALLRERLADEQAAHGRAEEGRKSAIKSLKSARRKLVRLREAHSGVQEESA